MPRPALSDEDFSFFLIGVWRASSDLLTPLDPQMNTKHQAGSALHEGLIYKYDEDRLKFRSLSRV